MNTPNLVNDTLLHMNRVEAFAEKMLQEHQETLNELAVTLTS